MRKKIISFENFISEKKKSPYKKATLLKYKRKHENGEEIPFGIESSLKAQGLIPRADGSYKVSDDYKNDSFLKLTPNTKSKDEIEKEKKEKKKVNEETSENKIDSAETTFRTKDKDGNLIYIKEIESVGACYEPYTHTYIFHNDKITCRENLEKIMEDASFSELTDYLNDVSINNEVSANVYMNLPYSQSTSMLK